MKIYTRTGDGGETSLLGGKRVPKDALRIEAYGTIDELNAHLGVVRTLDPDRTLNRLLTLLQARLFVLGADLATPTEEDSIRIERISARDAEELEKFIDDLEQSLSPLKTFILPTGVPVAAQLHVARTVCRRAERVVAALGKVETIGNHPLVFVNRLSDLLFVMARYANHVAGRAETAWKSRE